MDKYLYNFLYHHIEYKDPIENAPKWKTIFKTSDFAFKINKQYVFKILKTGDEFCLYNRLTFEHYNFEKEHWECSVGTDEVEPYYTETVENCFSVLLQIQDFLNYFNKWKKIYNNSQACLGDGISKNNENQFDD